MELDHFGFHLEANGCHTHRNKPHRDGRRLVFRRNDDHNAVHVCFSCDGVTLSKGQICSVCHSLNIPVPERFLEEDGLIRAIKRRDFHEELEEE
jgi:hypothetical protein